MCGRIGQFSAWQSYVDALEAFREHYPRGEEHQPRYNAGPGTRIATLFPDGTLRAVWWGYRPHWAVGRMIPAMINARSDKLSHGTWKPLVTAGRVIVPADCWYEWIKNEDGKKQPFLLRGKDGSPLYLAALTNSKASQSSGPHDDSSGLIDGVVIVTDKSDAGMVDIHDRRPVALSANDAMRWLDQGTDTAEATEIARDAGRPVSDFEWFEVSRKLNSTKNDGPDLIDPIKT